MPDALPHPYFFTRLLFPPSELARLTDPLFRSSTVSADGVTLDPTWLAWLERVADQAHLLEPIAGISWLELRTYMTNTLLRDTDSVSMDRSLEVRVPLLDTALVEFMCALPDVARVQPGRHKALLVAAVQDLLRRTSCNRRNAPSPCRGKNGCAALYGRASKRVSRTWRPLSRLICIRQASAWYGIIFCTARQRGPARGRFMC